MATASEEFEEEDEEAEEGGTSVPSGRGELDPGKINDITGGQIGGDSGEVRGRLRGGGGIEIGLLDAETESICCELALPASVTPLELD